MAKSLGLTGLRFPGFREKESRNKLVDGPRAGKTTFAAWVVLSGRSLAFLSIGLLICGLCLVNILTVLTSIIIISSILIAFALTIAVLAIQAKKELGTLTLEYMLERPLTSGRACTLVLIAESHFKSSQELVLRAYTNGFVSWKTSHQTITIPAGPQQSRLEFVLCPIDRSKLSFTHIYGRIALRYHLGYLHYSLAASQELSAQVYPNTGDSVFSYRANQQLGTGIVNIELSGGEGREFDSFRRYTAGEDLRRVDWKQSAKGKGLLVKCYRPETHQRILISIDCSRRMLTRVGERLQLEYATDAAAHLLTIASKSEDEIGLLGFAERAQCTVSCGKGRSQHRELLQALLRLHCSDLDANYQLVKEWADSQRRRSLILVVTCLFHSSNVIELGKYLAPLSRKHLPVVFSLNNLDLQALSLSPARNLDDAFASSAATKMLREISAHQKSLRRSGIECIDTSAPNLTKALEHKYMQLKLGGRL